MHRTNSSLKMQEDTLGDTNTNTVYEQNNHEGHPASLTDWT